MPLAASQRPTNRLRFCNITIKRIPMRTPRLFLSTISLVFILAPAITLAQGNAKEIMAKKPAELIEILEDSNSTTFEKAKACQRLAVAGTKDAIPALVALLSDEKLNCYARTALENIPGPAVDAALREAAKTLKGRQLIGVIDSIGQRRDAKAVELLAKYLENKDTAVASAAAGALGRIGTLGAGEKLFESLFNKPRAKVAVADGILACADRLEASGDMETIRCAALNYAMAAGKAGFFSDFPVEFPKYVQIAGLRGLFRSIIGKTGDFTAGFAAGLRLAGASSKTAEAKVLLLGQISALDKDFFNVGLAVAREMPGEDITEALVGELEKLPAERRALLLLALADRKEQPKLKAIVKESKNASEEVRKAAVYALSKRGDPPAAAVLIDIALGNDAVAAAAKDGLIDIPGKGIDATITDKYATANAHAKTVLLELIGDRRITAAMPMVRQAIDDADQPVRLAALAAMAKLIDLRDLNVLIDRALASGISREETAAAKAALDVAVLRMGDRDACAAKLAGYIDAASAENRSCLFDLLRKVSGKKALEAVVARVNSDDPAQKDSATRVLGEWVNADAAPALLDIAKNDSKKKYRIRALRGYIRIARQLAIPWWEKSDAPAVKLAMYDKAMAVAGRSEEKRLALDILTRIPSPATLSRAVARLDDPALKNSAAATAVNIAGKLVGSHPKVVAEAMRKVLDAGVGGKTGETARQLLDRTGGGK